MIRTRAALRRVPGLVAAMLSAGLLAGCMSMPVEGPVVSAESGGPARDADPADIVVHLSVTGASPTEIVVHFLDAMTASPISTSVASEYLTREAAETWRPEQQIITYADKGRPFGTDLLRVSLVGANYLDARGSWQGALPEARSTLRFPVVLEEGEWRIARAPNALIVPDPWFQPRFQQVSLYFFDPTGSVVVPEPVFLPRGEQLPTVLTANLLLGPPDGLQRVYRTFLPAGLSSGLSVPVTRSGVAEIELEGDASELTPQTTGLMLAQLTWTLRQVPEIESLRVSIGGEVLDVPGDADVLPVTSGAEYDPTGVLATSDLFALREGLLVAGPVDDLQAIDGPFGREVQGLRSVAVTPDGLRVAGATTDGRILVARVTTPGRRVRQLLSGGTDLLQPSWDLSGRLWVVDRTGAGAQVTVLRGGEVRSVRVPGITGRRVRTATVSRDGTRLVAVLAGRAGDAIVVSRLGLDAAGAPVALRAERIRGALEQPLQVRDLGWATPASVAVLSPLAEGLSQVRTIALDGSPDSGRTTTTSLRGPMRWLASSPVTQQPTYAISRQGVVDLAATPVLIQPEAAHASITYAG